MKGTENEAELVENDALTAFHAAAGNLGAITAGMAAWAGIVTLLLVVIIAIIFKRLRKSKTWDAPPPSHISDAESAVSESSDKGSYGKESYDSGYVVDVDITGHSDGHINKAYDKCSNLDGLKPHHTDIAQVH